MLSEKIECLAQGKLSYLSKNKIPDKFHSFFPELQSVFCLEVVERKDNFTLMLQENTLMFLLKRIVKLVKEE